MLDQTSPRSRQLSLVVGCIAGLLTLVGCQAPGQRLAPTEKADLERRARNLLLEATESEFDDVAMNAIEALVNVDPQAGIVNFRQAIESGSSPVRYAGLLAVGTIRDRQSLPLIRRCLNDSEPRVRLAAAFAALRCGGSEQSYGPLLANALRDHPDDKVRATAADLIGRLGERRAVARLRRAVETDKSPLVVMQSYAALAMLGDEAGVDQLIMYTQGDRVARLIALQTMAELAIPRTRDALRDRLYVPETQQEHAVLRLIAARGLGKLGSDEGYDAAVYIAENAAELTSRLANPQDQANERMKLLQNASLALGAIGRESALPLLSDLARNDEPPVQVAACYAILQILHRAP
ncbi:MAG: HEAT repeat domain-containing protein [Phycisphaerae bacterium]|nr:HEAT repeat domain-containing protein [Phycisphaerae bacterium]